MIRVEDKIPFFRKIMENEFKVQLDWLNRAYQADFVERQDTMQKRLQAEMMERSERQQHLIDLDRRNRLGKAEADFKQARLDQRDELMSLLRQDLSRELQDWLVSDELLERIAQTIFHRADGPETMSRRFQERFPQVEYHIKPITGFILYNDEERSRIDLTMNRWLERYEKDLSQAYQEMVGSR